MSRASTLSGFTTAIGQPTNLNVGVITAVTVSSDNVLFDDNLTIKQLTAIGVGVTNLNVSGVSTLSALNVSGVSTLSELNVSGVSTFSDVSIADKIVHTGDTDTTLRFPTVDTITAETDGTERLRITSDGDVGIGDNAPNSNYGTNLSVHSTTTTGARLKISDGTTGKGNSDGLDIISIGGIAYFNNLENADMSFSTGNVERIRVTSAGNVGIGSTLAAVSVDISEKNDAVALPVGTTAQRPSTAYGGYIRWNSTNTALEVYNGTNWVEIISDYFPSGSTTLG